MAKEAPKYGVGEAKISRDLVDDGFETRSRVGRWIETKREVGHHQVLGSEREKVPRRRRMGSILNIRRQRRNALSEEPGDKTL